MSLLALEGVSCLRGGRLLFEGLDLSLSPGEAVQVAGPNGTGKSSLIRIVAGLLAPATGKVERTECALADERLALDRDLPLGRALDFWIGPIARAAALDAVGLAIPEVPVAYLSTGQKQRARLARVIGSGAPLWLLDEPLNGLDADGRARIEDAVARHRAGGGAVLAASHQPLAGEWRTLDLSRRPA